MRITDINCTFHTPKLKECVEFYIDLLDVKVVFDCPWYYTIKFDGSKPMYLNFQIARECDTEYKGGCTLNILVEDVDTVYRKMKDSGVEIHDHIEDHDWGDRSFTVLDPVGTVLYIYSPREFKGEFKEAVIEPVQV